MHVDITVQDLIDILVKDNVNAYKQLHMTHEKLSSLRRSMTANQFSLPAEFPPRTISDILRGPSDSIRFWYNVFLILGAVQTFVYEFRKLYRDIPYTGTRAVQVHTKVIEWMMTRAVDANNLDWRVNRLYKANSLTILDIIARLVPTGELILSALRNIIDKKQKQILWSTYDQERRRIEMTYLAPIVKAYVSQIGSTRPGFTYEKIQELIEQESQRVKVYMFEMLEVVRKAHNRNARRTSARFAMDQLRIKNKTTGATQTLPDEIVNTILHHAELSHVKATTPMTHRNRLMERERDKKHMLHIIKGIRKRKRNFWA
jgi:hypothetical protein